MNFINLLKDNTLYTNSFYLIASSGIAYASGFLFWILAAQIYSTEQIGTATAIFSLVSLISSLSLVGLNTGLLRYLPSFTDRNEKINSSIIITTIFAGLIAVGVLLLLPVFFEPLSFIRENILYSGLFVFFTVISTLNLLSDAVFTAYRASWHIFLKTVLQSLVKLILPGLFIALGAVGIFTAISLGTLAALIYSVLILILYFEVSFYLKLHLISVRTMAHISFGTYISGLITLMPAYLLPLFITSFVNPTATAYYFIAATTVNVLYIIPQVITQNLLVEGSYREGEIKQLVRKTSHLMNGLLIPAIFMMIFFGDYILAVFGKQYSAEGLTLLRLMSVAGIFVGINYIFGTLLTIYQHIKLLIFINLISTLLLLILSYWFLHFGILGIGIATLVTQMFLTILYGVTLYSIRKFYLVRCFF